MVVLEVVRRLRPGSGAPVAFVDVVDPGPNAGYVQPVCPLREAVGTIRHLATSE